jgi:hypothetical protein
MFQYSFVTASCPRLRLRTGSFTERILAKTVTFPYLSVSTSCTPLN